MAQAMERERLAGIRMENERQEMERQRERVQRLDEQERERMLICFIY